MSESFRQLDLETDEHLAAAAQGGSSVAFEQLVRRYQVPLLRYLMRCTARRADAEDVLQETFLRAYSRLGQYRPSARFKPWLFTIAHNTAVNHNRRPVRAVESDQLDAVAEDAEDGVAAADGRRRLWAVARDVLSADQYDAVWLHYVEDLRTSEVARVMGRSWVSVKTLLVRARRRLEPHLRAHDDVHEPANGRTRVLRGTP